MSDGRYMKEQDLDKIIGGKLREYQEQPPEELFSRIEKSLASGGVGIVGGTKKVVRRRILAPIWKYAGVAALVCALLATSLYLRNSYNDIQEEVTSGYAKVEKELTQHDAPLTAQDEVNYELRATTAVAGNNILPEVPVIPEAEEKGGVTEPVAGHKDSTDSVKHTLIDNSVQDNHSDTPYHSDMRQRTEQWDNLLAADTPKARRDKISVSLFAGNLGVGGGGRQTNNPDKVIASGMLLKEQSHLGGDHPSLWTNDEGDIPSAAAFQTETQSVSMKHYMPLNVGLSLSIPLGERVSINTGINYSYLFSSSTQSFSAGGENRTTRELHYIGIPLGVSYKFFSKKGFDLYVYGGGAVDKAVAWREVHHFSNATDRSKQVLNRSVKGVQLSVTASAGMSYNINQTLSVYLEPGVSYYFERKHQPTTYWTAYPTNFSVRLGVRFGI